MKIIHDWPPNIEEIEKVFTFTRKVIFAYYPNIYNPDGVELDDYHVGHEQIHLKQQEEMGVEEWWQKYLTDSAFRLSREIPAYREQYQMYAGRVNDLERVHSYGRKLAEALSGDTYGYCIEFQDALKEITA